MCKKQDVNEKTTVPGVRLAVIRDMRQVKKYDAHLSVERLSACINDDLVYVLCKGDDILGILRYSLFWQTIPFLDLLFLDESVRGRGYGTQLMAFWENEMRQRGYTYVMTSTQADETAWRFYEKSGYRKIGSFLPPGQDADEWMYLKTWSS